MSATHPSVFATTRWTRVLAARGDSEEARAALSDLCAAYYAPVVTFLSRTGCGPDEPREVAHEFFAVLLTHNGLDGADPNRGRFRSYLLGALKHFVANRRLAAARVKRGGGACHQSIEAGAETGANPGAETDTPVDMPLAAPDPQLDAVFDHEWALTIVETSLATLEREADANGSRRQFDVLRAWLSATAEPEPQAEAATRLGISEGALKVAVHRLRRRFRDLVRAAVAQTLPAGGDVEGELRHLMEALARGSE